MAEEPDDGQLARAFRRRLGESRTRARTDFAFPCPPSEVCVEAGGTSLICQWRSCPRCAVRAAAAAALPTPCAVPLALVLSRRSPACTLALALALVPSSRAP